MRQPSRRGAGKRAGTLSAITGIDSLCPADPQPVVTESVQCEGYVRQRMEIHTEPGVVMTLYALLPDDLQAGGAAACSWSHRTGTAAAAKT